MGSNDDGSLGKAPAWAIAALVGVVLLGGWRRFDDLGGRSLWLDELSTWHVSRMELGPSLRWGPELTKPPLYQFTLRAITDDDKPSEGVLRLPAAICGMVVIAAGWALGRGLCGWACGLGLALLLAVGPLQVEWSREARPYSMLALFSLCSSILWLRLVRKPSAAVLAGYVFVTVLGFHAHYLIVLTVLAQVIWWILESVFARSRRFGWSPLIGIAVTSLLCVPMGLHFLRYRSSVFQGLDWIPPADWAGAVGVLERIAFGPVWAWCVLPLAVLLWIGRWRASGAGSDEFRDQPIAEMPATRFLIAWLLCGWFGLLVISWIAHPVLVARYALPAAVPALLIPLMVSRRVHPSAPLVLAGVFAIVGIAGAATQDDEARPGFREMVAFLNEHVDRDQEAVVLCLEEAVDPEWATMKRLGFDYYPLDAGIELHEVYLDPEFADRDPSILRDPRALYVLVFRADPLPLLLANGRHGAPIEYGGADHPALAFGLYRVLKVAPLE